jgi:hypothetical protein
MSSERCGSRESIGARLKKQTERHSAPRAKYDLPAEVPQLVLNTGKTPGQRSPSCTGYEAKDPGLRCSELWKGTVLSRDRVLDDSRINLQTLRSCNTRPAFFQIYSSVHPYLLMEALLNLEEPPLNLPNSSQQRALLGRRLENTPSATQTLPGVERGRKERWMDRFG